MASVKVRLKVQKEILHGNFPIVMQVIHQQKKRVIHLGHTSRKNQWNFESHLPNSKHPIADWLRGFLIDRVAKAEKILLQMEMTGKPFTVDMLAEKLSTRAKSHDLISYTESLVYQLTSEGKHGNARVYQTLVDIFNLFIHKPSFDFVDLDYRILKKFEGFLYERGVKTNTVSYYMRTLRAVYNRAIKEGMVDESLYPFKTYKIISTSTVKRAISKDEIIKIRDLNLDDDRGLRLSRDIFMFSFYTRGMSFVDIIWLKVSNVKNNRLQYTRKKTKQQFSIELVQPAIDIIERYCAMEEQDSYLFPILNRKDKEYSDYENYKRLINKHLGKIAKVVKITTPLTTYVARHSWSTLAKYMGVETAKISEALGHTTEKTTQIYLDSFENATLDDINKKVTL